MFSAEYQAYMYSYPHKTAYRPLENICIKPHLENAVLPDLYFHIPFCSHKCAYCNLFSVAGQNGGFLTRYVDALCEHFLQLNNAVSETAGFSNSSALEFRSITIGGGTPLLLPEKELVRLLSLTKPHRAAGDWNFSVETSPGETTAEKTALLKQFSVDRVSLGVQSLDDAELALLGRGSSEEARKALLLLKQESFPCLNIDLIYGIPGQGVVSWARTVQEILAHEPEEIFIYPLYIREGTALYSKTAGKQSAGDKQTDERQNLYCIARDMLCSAGYVQQSMRRFVKSAGISAGADSADADGASCGLDDMIGIGCGARTYLGKLHFSRPYTVGQENCLRQIEAYIADPDKANITHGFILSADEQKRRFVIKNILHSRGLSIDDYRDIFNTDAFSDFPLLNQLAEKGDAVLTSGDHGFIRLTEQGLALSDMIGPRFISQAVRERMRFPQGAEYPVPSV